jgi:hypothetical protein
MLWIANLRAHSDCPAESEPALSGPSRTSDHARGKTSATPAAVIATGSTLPRKRLGHHTWLPTCQPTGSAADAIEAYRSRCRPLGSDSRTAVRGLRGYPRVRCGHGRRAQHDYQVHRRQGCGSDDARRLSPLRAQCRYLSRFHGPRNQTCPRQVSRPMAAATMIHPT